MSEMSVAMTMYPECVWEQRLGSDPSTFYGTSAAASRPAARVRTHEKARSKECLSPARQLRQNRNAQGPQGRAPQPIGMCFLHALRMRMKALNCAAQHGFRGAHAHSTPRSRCALHLIVLHRPISRMHGMRHHERQMTARSKDAFKLARTCAVFLSASSEILGLASRFTSARRGR